MLQLYNWHNEILNWHYFLSSTHVLNGKLLLLVWKFGLNAAHDDISDVNKGPSKLVVSKIPYQYLYGRLYIALYIFSLLAIGFWNNSWVKCVSVCSHLNFRQGLRHAQLASEGNDFRWIEIKFSNLEYGLRILKGRGRFQWKKLPQMSSPRGRGGFIFLDTGIWSFNLIALTS